MTRLLCVLLLATPAIADDAVYGFGVNAPFGWVDASIGVSAYRAIGSPRHAVRVDVLSYSYKNTLADLGPLFNSGKENTPSGRSLDVGASWTFFHRGLLDGFTLEAGPLLRRRDTTDSFDFDTSRTRDTTTFGVRGMFGWSWTIKEVAFISATVGMSIGWERGSIIIDDTITVERRDVSESDREVEGTLRFGVRL